MTTSLHNLIQVPQPPQGALNSGSSILNQSQNSILAKVDELAAVFRPMRPTTEEVTVTLEAVISELVDDITLGVLFDVHRAVKKGFFLLSDTDDEGLKQFEIIDRPGFDIFGQLPPSRGRYTNGPSTSGNLNQYECPCPNCGRTMAVSRFAPHLEKCMIGLGRTSGRIASRRLADLGAFLFADRSTSSASSDTASSASRSSLGEDDFEWTTRSGSKSKRSRATAQRKQLSAPAVTAGDNNNQELASEHSLMPAPLLTDSRLALPATPTSSTTPRRQPSTSGGGSKRNRQSAKSKNQSNFEHHHSLESNASSASLYESSSSITNNKRSVASSVNVTPSTSRPVGNVFETIAAEMMTTTSRSSTSSGSTKGKLA